MYSKICVDVVEVRLKVFCVCFNFSGYGLLSLRIASYEAEPNRGGAKSKSTQNPLKIHLKSTENPLAESILIFYHALMMSVMIWMTERWSKMTKQQGHKLLS